MYEKFHALSKLLIWRSTYQLKKIRNLEHPKLQRKQAKKTQGKERKVFFAKKREILLPYRPFLRRPFLHMPLLRHCLPKGR